MIPSASICRRVLSVLVTALIANSAALAADWSVPLAGNTYRTAPGPGGNGAQKNGMMAWSDSEAVFAVFFHVDRAAEIDLAITAAARSGRAVVKACVAEQCFETVTESSDLAELKIGRISVKEPGYVRVNLQGVERTGDVFGEFKELLISSDNDGLKVDFVRNNDGGMYYWGRRGPSVHLGYQLPRDVDLRYAYSEITVPEGQDPIGTFYMANGFGQGYFGMQVNGPEERRVLFSIWSPFKTDNPRDIPEDQRIVALARGPKVHIGEFGNEGSGGQSYLVYPWKAGRTYRFVTKVVPDGKGSTVYTSWFGDKATDEWILIASFRRPQTDTHLRGFHSFLESFDPSRGHIGRRAFYGNVWVCDIDDNWHECTQARFTVDPTGRNRHRLDFAGGADGSSFFLRNCGFFNETVSPDQLIDRKAAGIGRPDINFDDLHAE